MKKLIISAITLGSLVSCGRMCPKMYTTFDKTYGRLGSFYSSDSLRIGQDTVIEGRKVVIVQVN